jgi:hypothetical protein
MKKLLLRSPLFYLLPLLALAYWLVLPPQNQFSNILLFADSGDTSRAEQIELPFSRDFKNGQKFTVSFDWHTSDINQAKLHIVPDDQTREILVNGKTVDLKGVQGLNDYNSGFLFDFSPYLHEGTNRIVFKLGNTGGPGGLRIQPPNEGLAGISLRDVFFCVVLFLTVVALLRKCRFGFGAVFVVLLGIALRLVFYSVVGITEFSHDADGHLKYIEIIANEGRIPASDECWTCYHSPTYYTVAAGVQNLGSLYDISFAMRLLQQLSLAFSFAALAFGVAFLCRWLSPLPAFLASLALAVWPGFVITAPRVGGDVPFYFGAAFCMFFALRWWQERRTKDVVLASLGAGLALAFKSTGFAVLGVWCVVWFLGVLGSFKLGSLRGIFFSFGIIALFAVLSQTRAIQSVVEGGNISLVGNSSGLNSNLKVKNEVGYYAYFDLEQFMLHPYTSPWDDELGRQYFWNYTFKTSLFGEFHLNGTPFGKTLAGVISLLCLPLLLFALWGALHFQGRDAPALLFGLALFAALAWARFQYPYSCTNDFRYIMPALVPLCGFVLRGIQEVKDSRLRLLGGLVALSFALTSALFILGLAV